MHDPVHDRVGMHPAAEPRVPVLLLELGAEDGRGRAVPQLHQLQQHGPEPRVRLVQQPLVDHEQAERAVLADQLPLAARALAALPPEVLERVSNAVLRDVGGAGDRVLRQPVHRPQSQDLPGPNPSRYVEPPRSFDCMAARA